MGYERPVSAERWTQEQFEDYWYGWAPKGALGVALPCDCDDPECHGWRMKVTYLPDSLSLFSDDDPGVMLVSVPVPPVLHAGDTFTYETTFTIP